MTISISVSVNGNYKCPVSYKQGQHEITQVISGFGHDGPNVLYIPFQHGRDAMTLSVGPEEPDHGDVATLDAPPTGPAPPPPPPSPSPPGVGEG